MIVDVNRLKSVLIGAIFATKLFSLWRRINRHKVTILMVHGVHGKRSDASWQPLWRRPSVREFEDVLIDLKKHYNFVSLDTAVQIIAGIGDPIDHAMVVTFDDGYANNFSVARPVLSRLGYHRRFLYVADMRTQIAPFGLIVLTTLFKWHRILCE